MKYLMTLIIAGLFAAGAAMANEGDVDFSKLDTDGDGQLSRTEVAQDSELAAQFSTLDADGDGYLAETEVTAASLEMEDESSPTMQDTSATEGEVDTSEDEGDMSQDSEDDDMGETGDDY